MEWVETTGKTVEEIERAMDRDNFLEADEAKAFGLVDDDMAEAQLFRIVCCRTDGDRPRMVKAVAIGRRARHNAGDLAFHDFLVK